MHGHQIHRRAQLVDVGEWGDVPVGALYSALHRLEGEGLVEAVRKERAGNFPARTVYAITVEGRRELSVLRQRAVGQAQLRADPIDVALLVAARSSADEWRALVEQRGAALTATRARYRAERRRLEDHGWLRPAARAIFRHWEQRLDAELRWQEELLGELDAIAAEESNPGAGAPSRDAELPTTVEKLPRKPRRSGSPKTKNEKEGE
jgi:DNA-binding PadR family transcriptional regulator